MFIYLGQEKVADITTTTETGIYTLITSEELIVVDGIVASPYAVWITTTIDTDERIEKITRWFY